MVPALPAEWLELLGDPHWEVEWIDDTGMLREIELASSSRLGNQKIFLYPVTSTPVCARPFWPEKKIMPGVFYPAGAIFPFDAASGAIRLSWQGGVDANFFKLLAKHNNKKRPPQNFDWKRFRELFETGKIEKEALANPWLADWELIAAKTVESSFMASRIKAQEPVYVRITIPASGPWINVSPFAPSYDWKQGETVSARISGKVQQYFCAEGVFRCAKNASVFRRWDENTHSANSP